MEPEEVVQQQPPIHDEANNVVTFIEWYNRYFDDALMGRCFANAPPNVHDCYVTHSSYGIGEYRTHDDEEQDEEMLKKLPKTIIFVGEGALDDRSLYVIGKEELSVPGYLDNFRAGKDQVSNLLTLCEQQKSNIVLGIDQRFEKAVVKYLKEDCGLPILDVLPEKPMATCPYRDPKIGLIWTWLSKNSDWAKYWNMRIRGTRPKKIAQKFPQFVVLSDMVPVHRSVMDSHLVKTDFYYGGFSSCDLDRATTLFTQGPGTIEAMPGMVEPELVA